jgi:hypothetical protein
MSPISTERTLGYSPKVVLPGLAISAFGAGLLVLGTAVDSRGLRAAGVGALAASAFATSLGYAAPPGAVVPPDHDVIDGHEHDHRVTQFEPAEASTTLAAY